jgi:hypothetical protein
LRRDRILPAVRRAALFSSAGDPPLQALVDAARELTGGPATTGIAYVPAATTRHDFFDLNALPVVGLP